MTTPQGSLSRCPWCHEQQDAEQVVNAAPHTTPSPGHVSICWSCHRVSVFAVGPFGLIRRKPTAKEQVAIDAHPAVRLTLAVMAESDSPNRAARVARRILPEQP